MIFVSEVEFYLIILGLVCMYVSCVYVCFVGKMQNVITICWIAGPEPYLFLRFPESLHHPLQLSR